MSIAAPAVPERPALSPGRSRRVGGWVVVVGVLVLVGVAAAVLSGIGQFTRRDAMDPASTAPDGTRALARVLDAHGVHVDVVRDPQSLHNALRAAGSDAQGRADATLVLPDSPLISDPRLRALGRAAADVVLLQPQARALRELFDSAPAGYGGDPVSPGCRVPAARRAGTLTPGALFTVPAGVTACYRVGDDAALLQRTASGTTVVAVDGTAVLTNDRLADGGNAALGVNLLGGHRVLVWYVPSQPDGAITAPTLGELTPSWVSPAIALLLAAGLAAAWWRGRRFGPLVSETLPVTVRASETADGRARLYARSSDPAHAARLLRVRTVRRLAVLLHLGPSADDADVAAAATAVLGGAAADVRDVLAGPPPHTDRELAALAGQLQNLERTVQSAARHPTEG